MKVRVGLGIPGQLRDAAAFWDWVDLCEASGVDSLWQSDRLITREPLLECISLLAALAGRTRRMKFGMSVAVVSFRDPLLLAKQCATIDWLSGGRLLPAFGIGDPQLPEWRATGREPAGRDSAGGRSAVPLPRLSGLIRADAAGEASKAVFEASSVPGSAWKCRSACPGTFSGPSRGHTRLQHTRRQDC